MRFRLFFAGLCLVAAVSVVQAVPPQRRVLRVALYPLVPMRSDMWWRIQRDFEDANDHVKIQLVDLSSDYYIPGAIAKALTDKTIDVAEIDTILKDDLVSADLLESMEESEALPSNTYLPVAESAVKLGSKIYGVPHWMCGYFLFSRQDDPEAVRFTTATSLADIRSVIGRPASKGDTLLMEMRGKTTLGEIYLDSLVDQYGSVDVALSHIDAVKLDSKVLSCLTTVFDLSPGGLSDSEWHHTYGQIYPRMFARRQCRAFIGYSEQLHYVIDEGLHGVPEGDAYVGRYRFDDQSGKPIGCKDISAISAPLAMSGSKGLAWVDMLSIRKGLDPVAHQDAQRFIAFLASRQMTKSLLVPADWSLEAPRYLLPARRDLYEDPDLLRAAPLYSAFKGIMLTSQVASKPRLLSQLRDIGKWIEKNGFPLPAERDQSPESL